MDRAPPQIFDRRRAQAKWARAQRRQAGEGASYLVDALADDIAERLDFMRLEPASALLIGASGTPLAESLRAAGTDIHAAALGSLDEEQPLPGGPYDLVAHLLGLGEVNDLPGALLHARQALNEGGLFIAAFPGAGSLPVLRTMALAADGERPAARLHPQIDNRAGTALLQRAGFARQVVDSYTLQVRFSQPERLVSDLRDHGLTSSLVSRAPPLTRSAWDRARAAFDALREDDGKVTERFEILVLTGWR